MKFSNKSFTPSNNVREEVPEKESKPFVRDESDNKLFQKYQVKDITPLLTDDCVAYYDADTLYFQAAKNQEKTFITVKNKEEGWSEKLPGIKIFKGLGKGIKKDSWLYMKNIDREVEGLPPYNLEDFEITEGQELIRDEDKCLEQAKIQVYMKLKRIKQQFRLPKIVTVIGEGENFRNTLPLCRGYKETRKGSARPLLLKALREWGIKELGAIVTPKSKVHGTIECDDYVDMQAYEGWLYYKKTGKFNKIAVLSDKDGYNAPKMLCNPDTYSGSHPQKGKFKYPQAVIVPNTSDDCGDIESIVRENSTDYKFIGFKGLLWQILTVDQADNYSALGHLNGGMGFGTESAYKLLKPCKTAKEALQATIDTFAEILPYGVQYTDCHQVKQDVTTMEYLNTYFRVVYMLRSMNDQMDFYKLCKAFKVDTSKIVDNNKLTPPQKVFVGDENHIEEINSLLQEILSDDLKAFKSLKKDLLVERLDSVKEKLQNISFESHYEMKSFKKEGL